jgi:hypothetical protein
MFANFFCKNWISGRKTRILQKSDQIFAKFPRLYRKNRIPRKTFFTIFVIFPQLYDFCEINISPQKSDSAKNFF